MKCTLFKSRLIAVGALVLSMFWTSVGEAGLTCQDLFSPRREALHQSAVEVEIHPTPKVMDLFTTTDGTIRPIVESAGVEAIKPELLAQLQDFVGEGKDPLDAPWDLLSHQEKIDMISSSAAVRDQDFYSNRVVPGLRYRDRITLDFNDYTKFLGQIFPPGKHSFAAEEVFGATKIEFMGANRMKERLGLEIHVRSSLRAGDNKLTSEALQRALVGQTRAVHEHIVAAYPKVEEMPSRTFIQRALTKLKVALGKQRTNTDPVQMFKLAEFVRRTNLYFDMKKIENGINMTTLKAEGDERGGVNFFPSNKEQFNKFLGAIWTRTDKNEGFSKAGTVGVRTKAHYDGTVWGIEIRYLSPKLESETTARVINFIQEKMTKGEFFVSDQVAKERVSQLGRVDEERQSRFLDSVNKLLYSSFRHKPTVAGSNKFEEQRKLDAFIEQNDFVKMLYHDWSTDPMFIDRPARIEQIAKAQHYCKELLFRGQQSTEVMKIFMKKSGIGYDLHRFFENQEQL